MKASAILRIVCYSLVIVLLAGILAAGLSMDEFPLRFNFSFPDGISGGTVSPRGSVDASRVRNLEIQWAAGSITIERGDVEEIVFSVAEMEKEDQQLVWKLSGDTLHIQFSRQTVLFGFTSHTSKDLVITVPRDWNCRELELDIAAANISVTGLSIDEVDLDGASGQCDFRDCQVGSLDVDTASGDIRFSGTLEELDMDAASADFIGVLSNTPSRVDMDCASGGLDLTLPEDCGFTVKVDALNSDFHSDFDTFTKNGQQVHGDGRCRITMDTASGDIYIRRGNE